MKKYGGSKKPRMAKRKPFKRSVKKLSPGKKPDKSMNRNEALDHAEATIGDMPIP